MTKIRERRILIVAAHPDDEVLGCGGTVARLTREGYEAYALILGEGVTARDGERDKKSRTSQIAELKQEARRASRLLGIKEAFLYDLPDNRFDTLPLLDIIKLIEKIKERTRPGIIFTHYEKDLNIDHQIVYKALLVATRPLKNETAREVYSFEIPSSTEWSYPLSFSPDTFFGISKTINLKLKAAAMYKGELRRYPHTRSLEGIRLNAKIWGMKSGLAYAEAFKTIRVMR